MIVENKSTLSQELIAGKLDRLLDGKTVQQGQKYLPARIKFE